MRDVDGVPDAVVRSARFLADRGVWHVVTQNPPVRSCAEAARHRRRLGSIGIPLCDELKSMLFTVRGSDGGDHAVLVHCRGHQRLDLDKLAALLGAHPTLVDARRLTRDYGAERGTVTPFSSSERTPVRHLVDDTVLADFYPPHTMMTNLGDLGHAVEFRAADLFGRLDDVVVGDIVRDADRRVPRQVLGVIVGGSPEAGSVLLAKITARIRDDARVAFRGTSGLPAVVLRTVPALGLAPTTTVLDEHVRDTVVGAVEDVCVGGATTVTVVSSDAARFSGAVEKVCSVFGARYVSPLREVAAVVRDGDIRSADLLGFDASGPGAEPHDVDELFRRVDLQRPGAWQIDALDHLTHAVRTQLVTGATITRLRDLVRSCRTGTAIVTVPELSVLLASQRAQRPSRTILVDALDAVASRMADVYVEERLATGAR